MEEDKKKILMIVIAVVCLVAAGMIIKSNVAPSRPKPSNVPVWLVCGNTSCNAQYSIEREEFQEQMRESMVAGGGPMAMMQPVLTCQQCSKKTAFPAAKCVNEDCGNAFVPNPQLRQQGGYPDKCPKCGTSATEQRKLEASK